MNSIIDLYARAAATLYGIISLDDFFEILDSYYGEGSLSRKRIMSYFRDSAVDDPIYYSQDDLIVHTSIFPGEIRRTLAEIQNPTWAKGPRHRKILPEKEFLQYANPHYYEDSDGARHMGAYLTDDLGLSRAEVQEIVSEMVFVCRTSSSPTLIMDALSRRGIPTGIDLEQDLLIIGIEINAGTRLWEGLGATGKEIGGS